METWRKAGPFMASNLGRVRKPGGRVLAQKRHRGYAELTTRVNGHRKTFRVHRLVATAFLGPARGRQVNHLNARRDDNRVGNLEWTTPLGNVRHCQQLGRSARGAKIRSAKLTVAKVAALRRSARVRGESCRSLGRRFGLSWSQAARIVRGESWAWLKV